jgi:protein-disulfide isomerase
MKKTLLLCSLLLAPGLAQAATPPPSGAGALDWSVQKTWELSTKPVDFVQSLDNKRVYVLGEDSKVYILDINGKEMGTIPVDANTIAIDIAPRGENLYLLGSDKKYTSISIAFSQNIDITGAPFLGNENAPVTMIVFSDFQ